MSSRGTYHNCRAEILSFLKRTKAKRPDFRVIDVGGAAGTWCNEVVDAYLDIRKVETSKPTHIGDICLESTWASIPEKAFDFSICTHVLEDIRDPLTAIRGLQRISRAGFVATPTKWRELSPIEDGLWLGNYHHRWIFDFKSEREITIIPKSVATNRFSAHGRLLYATHPFTIVRRLLSYLGVKQSGWLLGPDLTRAGWSRAAGPEKELSFIWRDEIFCDFHDWYPNARALLDHCRDIFERDNRFAAKPLDATLLDEFFAFSEERIPGE
jgi:hypothetical protein